VAELLYKALDEEYEAWKAARSVQSGDFQGTSYMGGIHEHQ
jgi:hypothetical protein